MWPDCLKIWDLKVEFLCPEYGRGKNSPYEIKKLNLDATGLRYLNLLIAHVLVVHRNGIDVRVPEPSAFVLQKHIVSEKRVNIIKRSKDKSVATEIGHYLLRLPEQRLKLVQVFSELPKRWQTTLLKIVKKDHFEMYEFLSGDKV